MGTGKVFFNNFKLTVLLLAVFFSPLAFSTGQLLSLHGRLTSGGAPLASGNIRAFIYNAASGGTLVYDSQGDFNGSIQNGVVDAMLGSGSQTLDLNQGSYYWLDLNVMSGANNVNLDFNGNDRKMFLSPVGNDINANLIKIPSTLLFTNTAGTSEYMRLTADGNVGIGTSSPGSRLVVQGFGTSLNSSPFKVMSSDGTTLLFVRDDNKFGVFTATPANKLNVVGDFNDSPTANYTVPGLLVNTSGAVGINVSSVTGLFDVNSGKLNVTTGGNVGIATTNSPNKLNILGDLNVSIGTNTSIPTLLATTTGGVGVNVLSPTGLFDVNSGKLVVLSSGNVGINTTTPSNKLNVIGDLNVVNLNASGMSFRVDANSSASPSTVIVDKNGLVGINNPANLVNRLTVIGDVNILTSATAVPSVFINSTDGNVALAGTAVTAGFRLDVTGDVRVSHDLNISNRANLQDVNLSNRLYRRESPGSNACMGQTALVDGNVTVTTSCVTASSRVFVTRVGGVVNGYNVSYIVGAVRSGSFDINSTFSGLPTGKNDGNTVSWIIVEPT